MKVRFSAVIISLCGLLLCGCGYHLGEGSLLSQYDTVCVPYIEGDHDGRLTEALVKNLEISGAIKYCHKDADVILKIKLLDFREENIGFRYDCNKEGTLTDNVIPSETRLTVLAEVTAIDSCSSCEIFGPDLLSASIDYDHDYYSNHGGVNVFSLGQLNDIDLAQQVAYRPLVRELAKRITDHVINSW